MFEALSASMYDEHYWEVIERTDRLAPTVSRYHDPSTSSRMIGGQSFVTDSNPPSVNETPSVPKHEVPAMEPTDAHLSAMRAMFPIIGIGEATKYSGHQSSLSEGHQSSVIDSTLSHPVTVVRTSGVPSTEAIDDPLHRLMCMAEPASLIAHK
jgi:hypothetical protein